jgi:transcriptional regulator with XRE-family HTH domain
MTKINDTIKIGQELRRRRQMAGISQQQIANEHGMVYATIRAAEQGKDVSMRTILAICESLKLRIRFEPYGEPTATSNI